MTRANLTRYIQHLSESFSILNVEVSSIDVERIATAVQSAMDNRRRVYHSSKHAFEMCQGMNPRQTLAALFHDTVYYQVDGGFPHKMEEILTPVLNIQDSIITLNPINPHNFAVKLCADVFGFKSGQIFYVWEGVNEFLSAVVAATLLAPYLKKVDLLAVVVIIETTIPFRCAKENGHDFFIDLAARIRKICKDTPLFDSEEAINHYVENVLIEAIAIANRDLGDFENTDHGKFLSSTSELLEEANSALSAKSFYTIQDHRESLFKMEHFLSSLKANQVFHHYSNSPSQEKLSQMRSVADKNIALSSQYLSAKITAIAIIEALAIETGGNCPASTLLGERYSDKSKSTLAEHHLPPTQYHHDLNRDLLSFLEGGRVKESKHDFNLLALTAFVYGTLGIQNVSAALDSAKKMFSHEISCRAFLNGLNQNMLITIINACRQNAGSRKTQLDRLGLAISPSN